MKYYLVITPKSLTDVLKSESKRLMHEIYDKKVTDLYYRVETKQELDDPQRLYIKGDGRVIEAGVKPHISLIHNIELEDSSDFIEKVQKIVTSYKPITLAYDGVGNYDKNFTFFVKYKTNELLTRLRSELLILSKEYMSRDEHDQHTTEEFTPHAAVLYDDVDPEKVSAAYELLNRDLFDKDVYIDEVVLWEIHPGEQKEVAHIKIV